MVVIFPLVHRESSYSNCIISLYTMLLIKQTTTSIFHHQFYLFIFYLLLRTHLQSYLSMQPEENNHANALRKAKSSLCPITTQINRYRNSLPEMPRQENHFFFKEVTRPLAEITYVSIGYRIGNIPFQLQDILAVIINNIHYSCELNLKLIIDEDNLWLTGSIGIPTQQLNSLRFRVQEAHLNDSLIKTQKILIQFLQEIRNDPRREDTKILEKLNKQIIKNIKTVYKNPDLQD